jgi:lipase maturation factor 1
VSVIGWMFDPKQGPTDRLIPRWIFLRGLGLIYFSAFYSLAFQIKGLIGPNGILPANVYLQAVASLGIRRFWFAPTLLWISSGPHMLMGLCILGILASLLLAGNLWPRGMLVICFLCFLSFVSAAQDFSGYQSDGMLLEAGFLSLFLAPSGFRPRWGEHSLPLRASLFLLQWEWFRIYFQSGMVKLLSGDPEWRNLTAMDEYYQNGPLPTWVGWYLQHLPHWFHWLSALGTLVLELGLVLMMFLPRRFRIIISFIATGWQIGVILSANYTFLNYLVLLLGILLLDDRFLARFFRGRFRPGFKQEMAGTSEPSPSQPEPRLLHRIAVAFSSVMLLWIFYATTAQFIWMLWPSAPFPRAPVAVLDPFRIANRYGLFAVMTRGRYEIEFQGSNDGEIWTAYPFRYKPQALNEPPGIYAPYQPRFDWNLWFASLGNWRDNMFVASTEERLLNNDPDVVALFQSNPFPNSPPQQIRAVLWQYWFTTMAERRSTGNWWKREYLGTYAPTLTQSQDGRLLVLEWPTVIGPRQ